MILAVNVAYDMPSSLAVRNGVQFENAGFLPHGFRRCLAKGLYLVRVEQEVIVNFRRQEPRDPFLKLSRPQSIKAKFHLMDIFSAQYLAAVVTPVY